MIRIANVVLPSPAQWASVIRGARNPKNSWDSIDSVIVRLSDDVEEADFDFEMGNSDFALLSKLSAAGTDHGKYLRMIPVMLDITAPLYWWKEWDTYKIGTTANSCSTMHKIHAKEFTRSDFSCDLLNDYSMSVLDEIIACLNFHREAYLETKDVSYWHQLIQMLPSSYNQRRTVFLNYAVLKNMYHARKNHKLWEWRELCGWIETLPYSSLITRKENADGKADTV